MKRRLISIPFFLLRTTTAGAAFVTGLVQTFVFAHVLSPQRFSIFILVAAIGYSLWLCDFGIVKILFVRLRARFLAGKRDVTAAGHATAVVLFYFLLTVVGALLCFAVTGSQTDASLREAAEFGLFFLFVALTLVWFALRNIAIAVDEYVLFEALETLRRGGYFLGLAAVFFGLPLIVMLAAMNALWALVLVFCVQRMIARGAMLARIGGMFKGLLSFFRANRAELMRSSAYAASDIYIYNYPYLIVPMLFGLGAPPIILDTTFKVFRGGATIFGAVCDILVPRQTSALAERDGPTLVRATLLAAALCSIPAAAACGILILGADKLFAFLLGNAATMPPATTPILVVLLIANLTQMVCHSVLVHTGYFKEVARIGLCVVVAMTAVAAFVVVGHLDIVQFLEAYTVIYACGALAAVVLMIRGPIRHAYGGGAAPKVALR
jgi:O-antigen/teichoic acid export membrane protein